MAIRRDVSFMAGSSEGGASTIPIRPRSAIAFGLVRSRRATKSKAAQTDSNRTPTRDPGTWVELRNGSCCSPGMRPNDPDPNRNTAGAPSTSSVPRQARAEAPSDRAPRGDEPGADRQEHGITAEDAGGVGFGEEGFRAEEYPGNNRLQSESEREQKRRHAYAWTWPRPTPEALAQTGEGAAADRRICEEIGQRILRAEPDLSCVVVSVLDGRVTLEGEVAESKDEQVVEALAESVQGVRAVESTLVVRRAETSAG